jgi:hypothetical protein
VSFGDGFNPLGRPSAQEIQTLESAMRDAGRDVADLEMVGGVRGSFSGPDGVADLDEALERASEQVRAGFGTLCVKPSQFVDHVEDFGPFCDRIVKGVAAW